MIGLEWADGFELRLRLGVALSALAVLLVLIGLRTVPLPAPAPAPAPARPASAPRSAAARIPAAAQGPVSAALGRADRRYGVVDLRAVNPAQRFALGFSRRGVTVDAGPAAMTLSLAAWGYASDLRPLPAVPPRAAVNTVTFARGAISEWYVNGPAGLEQGFEVTSRPAPGAGPLTLSIAVTGTESVRLDHGAILLSARGAQLRYGSLAVTDARGRTLPATLALARGRIAIEIDDRGAAYPLRIDPWVQQAELTATGSAGLGTAIALSGTTLAVGAPNTAIGGHGQQGAVYVFTESGSSWSQTAELTASDGAVDDGLGTSVAIAGQTIVAGAPYRTVASHAKQGELYVFTESGSTWSQTAELKASDGGANDELGYSVALTASGGTIVAGAPAHTNQQGAVYVYTGSGSTWKQAGELTDGISAETFQEFLGWSVAVTPNGSTIVAGAPNLTNVYGNYIGGALVYDEPSTGWASETQAANLADPDTNSDSQFGASVAIAGQTIAVGAPEQGEVYVFTESGSTWSQAAVLANSADTLGESVAISSDATTIVSAGATSDGEARAAYVFTGSGSSWAQSAELTAADGGSGLGDSLLTTDSMVIAGAPDQSTGAGAVYVFGTASTAPPPSISLTAPAYAPSGLPVNASAIVASLAGGNAPTGSITYTIFGPLSAPPTSCTSGGTADGTTSVTHQDGLYSPPANWTPGAAGNYYWYATYSGDGSNSPAASPCGASMPETTVYYSAEVDVSAPPNDKLGTAIPAAQIQAELMYGDAPTGTVTFTVFGPQNSPPTSCTSGGTTVGTATVSGDGSYSPAAGFTPTSAGYYWWYVSYSGDANNDATGSLCDSSYMTETVVPSANAANPTLTMTAPSSDAVGTEIPASSLSATLSGGSSPTGSIVFTVYGPQTTPPSTCSAPGGPSATVSGNGTYHPEIGFTPPEAGDYWWYASYNGDINNNPAGSACGSAMAETVVGSGATTPTVTAVKPDVGPLAGGTTVTVTGTNFLAGSTSVAFGANPGTSVDVHSSTSLTVVTPAGSAGAVNVTVTVSGHASKTSSKDLFAYGPPGIASFTPSSGITGSTVTVTGSGFAKGVTVKFGTLASPKVTVTSGTQLTAVVPNGDPGASTLTVGDAQGSGSSSGQFTPTLSIASFTPTSGAAGTAVTIKGIGFTASSTVAFNGTAAGVVSQSPTQLVVDVPAGATTGFITVTNPSGASPVGTVTSAHKYTV